MNDFELKQSGNKQTFKTGAQRDSQEGKPEQWMGSPLANMRYGHLLAKGASHYGMFNYMKGFPLSRTLASLQRHVDDYLLHKLGFTPDDNEDHAAAIRFGADVLMHTEEAVVRGYLPEELLDLKPPHVIKPVPREGQPESQSTVERERALVAKAINAGREMAGFLRRREGREKLAAGEPILIYVAGPFTGDGTQCVKDSNQIQAENIGRAIKDKGHYAHVPHAATAFLENGDSEQEEWKYFMTMDLMLIDRAMDALFFIGSSPGADREKQVAEKLGISVFTDLAQIPTVTKVTRDTRLEEETP